jgi:hypothetical protein
VPTPDSPPSPVVGERVAQVAAARASAVSAQAAAGVGTLRAPAQLTALVRGRIAAAVFAPAAHPLARLAAGGVSVPRHCILRVELIGKGGGAMQAVRPSRDSGL